ncbi:MAG: hypothetical protein WCE75_17775 [Terracidiphilus sp.]
MDPQERAARLEALHRCRQAAERAYDELYEAGSPSHATGCYSEAKEALYDAIRLAEGLGLAEEARALEARLAHIKAVFRSQFS